MPTIRPDTQGTIGNMYKCKTSFQQMTLYILYAGNRFLIYYIMVNITRHFFFIR